DWHRRGILAVRADVGPQGRARTGAVRLDRPHAVRARSVARDAAHERAGPRRTRRVSAIVAALARDRRYPAARDVRRLLHRAALRADPATLGAGSTVADHRREQHPERALYRRVRCDCNWIVEGRADDS